MDTNNTYSFKFQNIKAFRYLFICLAWIPIVFFLEDAFYIILIIVVFTPLILGIVLMIKNITRSDVVVIEDTFLTSQYYGRIDFSDIVSANTLRLANPPNIRLKLKNGRKITWVTNTIASSKNSQELMRFITALANVIQQGPSYNMPASRGETIEKKTKAVQDLKQEMEKIKNKNLRPQKFLFPASLGVAILLFSQNVLIPYFSHHRDDKVKQIFSAELEENAQLKNDAVTLINNHKKQHGPFFLFTNDTAATLTYLPTMMQQDFGGPLGYVFENDSLRKIINHPDSTGWNIAVLTGDNVYVLKKGLLNEDDSADTYVYIAEIDSAVKVENPQYVKGYSGPDVPDSIDTQLGFAIPLYKNKGISESLEKGIIGYEMFLAMVKFHPDDCKLYLAARNGEGRMNEELFNRVAAIIKKDLSGIKADTTKFIQKIY